MTCPVCSFDGVSEGMDRCPQCDADLSCFQTLAALPDEVVVGPVASATPTSQPRRNGLWPVVNLVVLVLLVALFLAVYWIQQRMDQKLAAQQSQFGRLMAEQKQYVAQLVKPHSAEIVAQAELLSAPGPTAQLTPTAQPKSATQLRPKVLAAPVAEPNAKVALSSGSGKRTEGVPAEAMAQSRPTTAMPPANAQQPQRDRFVYHRQPKETLWQLAKRFYGNGERYPVFFELNPDLEIYAAKPGGQLVVLKNRAAAKNIFKRLVVTDGHKRYWLYTVGPGETFESIAIKLLGVNAPRKIIKANPDVSLAAGVQLRIELE